MRVPLTIHEIMASCAQATHRITASEASRLNHASTYDRPILERYRQELEGVIAERAFCKWLGVYSMEQINTFHDVPDCGDRYEIRSTSHKDGRLIVRDNDANDRIYVLVLIMSDGAPLLCGWVTGAEAKCDEFLDNPKGYRPAWFVPQHRLHPMTTLPKGGCIEESAN